MRTYSTVLRVRAARRRAEPVVLTRPEVAAVLAKLPDPTGSCPS